MSEAAIHYLNNLVADKKDSKIIGIRMFVDSPGTPQAETCIAYCVESDVDSKDAAVSYGDLTVWVCHRSQAFLLEATVDYLQDEFGGQLTIRAPYARTPKLPDNASFEERVNYVLWSVVNPNLASHGGTVTLVEANEGTVVLQFGGGCQGCGMVDVTLREGIEKTLKEHMPEVEKVLDVTDHTDRSQAYYQ